jgi:hypothetical protein
MRLSLSLLELEQGWSVQTGPTDRIVDIGMLAHKRETVSIVPLTDHDHRIISIIRLIDDVVQTSPTSCQIKFRPVWCRVFTLCSAKKNSLLALLCEFTDRKYWVNNQGWKECEMTTDGPGTDPMVVYNSQFLMSELFNTWPRPDIVFQAAKLIQENY